MQAITVEARKNWRRANSDPRMQAWAVEKLLAYGIGTPVARREEGVEIADVVLQVWEKRKALEAGNAPLLPRPARALISASEAPAGADERLQAKSAKLAKWEGRPFVAEPAGPPPTKPVVDREAEGEAALREWDAAHGGVEPPIR